LTLGLAVIGSAIGALLNTWFSSEAPSIEEQALAILNRSFQPLPAAARIERILEMLPGAHVVASSFGAQAAVTLHLVTEVCPGIPVILIDTGYLFPETYRFVDQLTERLNLNLRVFRSEASSAWQESRFGKLWEQGLSGIERYNRMNKQEPMERALGELDVGTWLSGIRRCQAPSRAHIAPIEWKRGRYKAHPIYDWSDRDVGRYVKAHNLPHHPLWEKGYPSIGDWHTTRSLADAGGLENLRFFGLKRECGLHET
jgi:phosphoadenosine phosphosulfate reductase